MGQTSIESDNERADPKLFELFVTPNSVMVPPKLPALGSIPEQFAKKSNALKINAHLLNIKHNK